MTSRFPCPYLNGEVELIEEREHHIAERHSDLLPEYREQIVGTREEGQIRGGRGDQRLGRDESPLDHHGLFDDQAGRRKSRMETKLTFKYDREADILHIDNRPSYGEQESEEWPDEIIARLNPDSGEIENLEVLFFSTRLLRADLFELPVNADLRLTGTDND
jgi:hypothetical protein